MAVGVREVDPVGDCGDTAEELLEVRFIVRSLTVVARGFRLPLAVCNGAERAAGARSNVQKPLLARTVPEGGVAVVSGTLRRRKSTIWSFQVR